MERQPAPDGAGVVSTKAPEEPAFGNYFVSTYPPFSLWGAEALEAFRQRLERQEPSTAGTAFGLYVHLPFCVRRCRYCYYLSHDDRFEQIDVYLDALVAELERYAHTPALEDRPIGFVYFGGGTPSLLSARRIRRLTRRLRAILPWSQAGEVSFECAPKSVTAAKLDALRESGVTRVSLGVQQLDDAVLAKSGRVHSVRDVETAWAAIRRVGFDVVNVDLIAGLPGEDDRSFSASLDRVIGMAPESVTIYPLEIPLNTPLYREARDGAFVPVSWDQKRRRLGEAFERLERAGYRMRSAYAATRSDAARAFVYQDAQYAGADLLGIGVSSFSYLGPVHQQNSASLGAYLDAASKNELPLWRAYALGPDERVIREFVLQLKLGAVDRRRFRAKSGVDPAERFAGPLARHARRGWLAVGPDAIRLTRAGLLRADRLLEAFYLPEHRNVRYS